MMRKGLMKGSGKPGYYNVVGKDPMVHSQSARGIKQPQRIGMYGGKNGNYAWSKDLGGKTYDAKVDVNVDGKKYSGNVNVELPANLGGKMTKRDYVKLADMIGKIKDPVERTLTLERYSQIAAEDNPKFDKQRFMAAVDKSAKGGKSKMGFFAKIGYKTAKDNVQDRKNDVNKIKELIKKEKDPAKLTQLKQNLDTANELLKVHEGYLKDIEDVYETKGGKLSKKDQKEIGYIINSHTKEVEDANRKLTFDYIDYVQKQKGGKLIGNEQTAVKFTDISGGARADIYVRMPDIPPKYEGDWADNVSLQLTAKKGGDWQAESFEKDISVIRATKGGKTRKDFANVRESIRKKQRDAFFKSVDLRKKKASKGGKWADWMKTMPTANPALTKYTNEKLDKGTASEKQEHPWANWGQARRIARDHLKENPKYYGKKGGKITGLKQMMYFHDAKGRPVRIVKPDGLTEKAARKLVIRKNPGWKFQSAVGALEMSKGGKLVNNRFMFLFKDKVNGQYRWYAKPKNVGTSYWIEQMEKNNNYLENAGESGIVTSTTKGGKSR